jgi:hypothetical protein
VAILLCAFCTGYLAFKSEGYVAYKGLIVEPPVVDLGKIPPSIQSLKVRLINQSNYPLRVLSVIQSCDCTAARVTTDPVKPSGELDLLIKWDSTGTKGPSKSVVDVVYEYITTGLETKKAEELKGKYSIRVLVKADIQETNES